jgi:hypothetical protein
MMSRAKTATAEEVTPRKGSIAEMLEKIRPIHERILERRKGEPLDVDAVLDELRGREKERQPEFSTAHFWLMR